jgi:mRNA-degrading endonuclease RelE of RelBE toxin-antitoxin system
VNSVAWTAPTPKALSTPWKCFAATGHGDVKALKGALKGRYRLRVGKWRAFFSLDQPGSIIVSDIDNRGQAY